MSATSTSNRALVLGRGKSNDYDLDDSSQLYCTELIKLVYAACGVDLCEERWHKAPIIAKGSVIYPEDIWQSPLLIHKKEF